MFPNGQKAGRRAFLDGNFARRKRHQRKAQYEIWDTVIIGFGMRVMPSGKSSWFVRPRHRGMQKRIHLGAVEDVPAEKARAAARGHLLEAALDGLPKRITETGGPAFADFFEEFWSDYARHWKPSTQKRSLSVLKNDLLPAFGELPVDLIRPADIVLWRDSCAGQREVPFNRGVPVMSAMMQYAEQLGYRPEGSNPCQGIARFPRDAVERFLSPKEYVRLGRGLQDEQWRYPRQVAIVRLLLFTGARVSEINNLVWDWVQPPRLALPDSKTGAKIILLNSQAQAILEDVERREGCAFVFPNVKGIRPVDIDPWWYKFRRRCALPDFRLHDFRHSFISAGILGGVPLSTVGAIVGHQLPETTAKYAHLADAPIADAAKRVSGFLAQSMGITS